MDSLSLSSPPRVLRRLARGLAGGATRRDTHTMLWMCSHIRRNRRMLPEKTKKGQRITFKIEVLSTSAAEDKEYLLRFFSLSFPCTLQVIFITTYK
jgi:hypothetical protein